MRRSLLLTMVIVATMAFASPVQAQKKSQFGIKGGLGLASLSGDITDVKSILSLNGGSFIRFSRNPQFSIQPEAILVLKGAQEDFSDGEKFKFIYFEVPVLFMYHLPTEKTFKPALFAGPAISMLLSAKAGDVDIMDNLKGIDIGLVFGAGLDFKAEGKGYFCIDGRYTAGITNIVDMDYGDDSIKNGVFSLCINYIFHLDQSSM